VPGLHVLTLGVCFPAVDRWHFPRGDTFPLSTKSCVGQLLFQLAPQDFKKTCASIALSLVSSAKWWVVCRI